jgi:hypothetical protein
LQDAAARQPGDVIMSHQLLLVLVPGPFVRGCHTINIMVWQLLGRIHISSAHKDLSLAAAFIA